MKRTLIILLFIIWHISALVSAQSNSADTMNPLKSSGPGTRTGGPTTSRPLQNRDHGKVLYQVTPGKRRINSGGASLLGIEKTRSKATVQRLTSKIQNLKGKAITAATWSLILFGVIAVWVGSTKANRESRKTWKPTFRIVPSKKADAWRDVYAAETYRNSKEVVIGARPDKPCPPLSIAQELMYKILPFLDKKGAYYTTTFDRLTTNTLICAPSGGGKSNVLFNYGFTFLMKNKPGIIIDPAASAVFEDDFLNAARVASRDRDVYVVDLQRTNGPTFGLFSRFPCDTPFSLANRICDAFDFTSEGKGDARFYLEQEARYIHLAIQFLWPFYYPHDIVPQDIENFIRDEAFRRKVISGYRGDAAVRKKWEDFEKQETKILKEATHRSLAILNVLTLQPLASIFNSRTPDLNILQISEENLFVLFKLPVWLYQRDVTIIGKIIVSNITGLMAYRNTLRREWNHFAVIIDEWASFAPASFFSLLNYQRKARLCCVIAMQSLAQLEKLGAHNTENIRRDLLQSCRHRLVGYQDDNNEAEFWSKRSKKITITQDSERLGRGVLRRREGVMRTEKEVYEYGSNIFKLLKAGEMWLDFVEDDFDGGDSRGSYGQGICFIPVLPILGKPAPKEVSQRTDKLNTRETAIPA